MDTTLPIISIWRYFKGSRPANSVVSDSIWPQFKLTQDITHVLFTCKLKKNLINSNGKKVETSIVSTFNCSQLNSQLSDLTKNIQSELETLERPQHLSHYKSLEIF